MARPAIKMCGRLREEYERSHKPKEVKETVITDFIKKYVNHCMGYTDDELAEALSQFKKDIER